MALHCITCITCHYMQGKMLMHILATQDCRLQTGAVSDTDCSARISLWLFALRCPRSLFLQTSPIPVPASSSAFSGGVAAVLGSPFPGHACGTGQSTDDAVIVQGKQITSSPRVPQRVSWDKCLGWANPTEWKDVSVTGLPIGFLQSVDYQPTHPFSSDELR